MKKDDRATFQIDIEKLKAGDEEVLGTLFQELQPKIDRFLWLRIRSVEASEDLIQEVFLRLWDNRTKLKSDTNIEAYLFRIASNLATDYLRSAKQRETASDELEVQTQESSSDIAEANNLAATIDKLLSKLSDAPRTAFILSRYEQLSHKEIADVMNISVKTVEKHISKALHFLKNELKSMNIISHD